MEIVEFTETDEKSFLSLCKDFYENHATLAPYDAERAKATFQHVLERHENLWGYMLTDRETKNDVGYALVTSYWCNEEGGNVLVLDELYISPKSRHNGYGTRFLSFMEEHFRGYAKAITLEVLKTNQTAQSLYLKQGLVPDGFETFTKEIE